MPDQKSRVDYTHFHPARNGVNVRHALKEPSLPATNCQLLAGEFGILVERLLGRHLDNLQAARSAGEARINCTIQEKNPHIQHELDSAGPQVVLEAPQEVVSNLLDAAQGGIGILTGSLPKEAL